MKRYSTDYCVGVILVYSIFLFTLYEVVHWIFSKLYHTAFQ